MASQRRSLAATIIIISPASCDSFGSDLDTTTTESAPSFAKSMAACLPIPDEAPVMTTVLPENFMRELYYYGAPAFILSCCHCRPSCLRWGCFLRLTGYC